MKFLIPIISLLICSSLCLKPKSGYQIAILEGLVFEKRSGEELKLLEYIGKNKTIVLEQNALVVLFDVNARFHEFTGPLTIDLDKLKTIGSGVMTVKPKFLYEKQYILGTNNWDLPASIFCPYNARNGIYAKDSIRVKWVDKSENQNYRVLGITLDGDTLINMSVGKRECTINPIPKEPVVLTILNEEYSSLSVEYGLSDFGNISKCESRSAVENIMIGLYLEDIEEFDIAHDYYVQALELSNKSVIKKLFDLHEIRYKKIKRLEEEMKEKE